MVRIPITTTLDEEIYREIKKSAVPLNQLLTLGWNTHQKKAGFQQKNLENEVTVEKLQRANTRMQQCIFELNDRIARLEGKK